MKEASYFSILRSLKCEPLSKIFNCRVILKVETMAWSCRLRKIDLTVYASIHANPFKISRMKELGAKVIQQRKGLRHAKDIARQTAAEKRIRFVEDSFDIETVIGAGTIGLELETMMTNLDAILVPLGNGALVNGISMGVRKFSSDTKIMAVQSVNASAMIESWQSGKVVTHKNINTIADGIGVRVPVVEALEDMKISFTREYWSRKKRSFVPCN